MSQLHAHECITHGCSGMTELCEGNIIHAERCLQCQKAFADGYAAGLEAALRDAKKVD